MSLREIFVVRIIPRGALLLEGRWVVRLLLIPVVAPARSSRVWGAARRGGILI